MSDDPMSVRSILDDRLATARFERREAWFAGFSAGFCLSALACIVLLQVL